MDFERIEEVIGTPLVQAISEQPHFERFCVHSWNLKNAAQQKRILLVVTKDQAPKVVGVITGSGTIDLEEWIRD